MVEKEQLVRLVRAVQQGRDDAATDLYNTFYQDIYYFIQKTVNDPELAADLTQDTFIEILQTIGNLKEPAAFVSWSRQIAYHRCTAQFRRRKELLADENEDGYSIFDTLEDEDPDVIPGSALEQQELKQTLHAMIGSLPEDQRAAILLRYFDELSVKEIARIQGVNEGTVKSRLNYGRKAIRQAVEDYEKKHDIRIHSVAIVPLLLWLFRQSKLSSGISLTAQNTISASTAVAAGATTGTAAAAATSTTAAAASTATATTTTAAAGAKAGAAIAGKALAVKIAAGVAATAIVAGGVAAALHRPEPVEEPEEEEISNVFVGYGEFASYEHRRFEITIDEMDEHSISGHLEMSYLYETVYESDFTGDGYTYTGDAYLGCIEYLVTFETPFVPTEFFDVAYDDISLFYRPAEDVLFMEDHFQAELFREDSREPELMARNVIWSGYGEDSFCYPSDDGHWFQLEITKMTDVSIEGTLTVSNQGTVEHISTFTGRGYQRFDEIYYEVALDDPKAVDYDFIGIISADNFWLIYNTETDTFETYFYETYHFVAEREN